MKTLAIISGIVAAFALTSCTRDANNRSQPSGSPSSTQPSDTQGTGSTSGDNKANTGSYDSGTPGTGSNTNSSDPTIAPSDTNSGMRNTENP